MILYKGKNPPQSWEETNFFRDVKTEEFLVIVPTNRKSRELKRKLTLSAATGINTEGINSFVTRIAKAAGIRFILTNDTISSIFIRQVTDSLAGELPYIKKHKTEVPPGTIRMFGNMISEYKRYGIYPADIYEKLGSAGAISQYEKGKARDFAKIYAELNKLYELKNIADYGDVYRKIIAAPQAAGEAFRKLFPSVKTIYAMGISEFTLPESMVFNTVAVHAGVEIIVNIDCVERNRRLFGINLKSAEQFERLGFIKIEDESPEDGSFRGYLRGNLFASGKKKPMPAGLKNSPVIYEIPAFDQRMETDFLLKEIKLLINDKKALPAEICVITPDPESYAPLLRSKFSRRGIPINLTYQYFGDDSSAVNYLTGLFSLLVSDFSYRDISRLSYSSYRTLFPVRFDILRKLMFTKGIKRGYSRVIKMLQEISASDLEKLDVSKEEIESDIKLLSSFTETFRKEQTVKEYKEAFEEFVIKNEIVKKIVRLNEPSLEVDFGGMRAFLFQLREVLNAGVDFGSGELLKTADFLKIMEDVLTTVRYNTEERPESGVLVTSPEEIRGLHFEYILICGLTEQVFPGRYRPALILDGKYHRSEENYYFEKRNIFYQTLTAAAKAVYITYPVTDGSRESAPSHFIRELKTVYPVHSNEGELIPLNPDEKQFSDLKAKTLRYYEKLIISRDELLIKARSLHEHISAEFGADYPERVAEAVRILKLRDEDRRSGKRIFTREAGKITEFTGKILNSKITSRKKFSVTGLESYANCPFRHLIETVLNLTLTEEPQETISERDKGKLVHEIMKDFFVELQSSGDDFALNGCSDEEFEKAASLLQKIAAEKIRKYESLEDLDRTTIQEELLGIKGNFRESLLWHFLQKERSRKGAEKPYLFEQGFEDYTPSAEILDGYEFKMKIDRIDKGIENDRTVFRVIDYKTGKPPTRIDYETGKSMQLQFYTRALLDIYGEDNEATEILQPSVFSFKRDVNVFGYKDIKEGWSDDSVFDKIKNLADNYTSGNFPLTSRAGKNGSPCEYCDKQSICRINEKI